MATTDRKHLGTAQETPSERSTRLVAITAAIAAAITAEEVFAAVVDQVAASLGASSAGLWLLEADRTARLVRSVGYREDAKKLMSGPVDRQPGMPILDAIKEGRPLWISSQRELLEGYPHLSVVVSPQRNYQISCLPIAARGATFGGLGFTFEDSPQLGDDERSFLMLVAGYCAQALERLRLLEAERASRTRAEAAAARMALLSSASRAFAEAGHDMSLLTGTIVREVNQGYAEACGITLLAEQGDDLIIAAVEHREPAFTALARALLEASPLKLGQGVSGGVAASGRAVLISEIDPSLYAGPDYAPYRAFFEKFVPTSVVAVPLRARGRVLGTLSAVRGQHVPRFEQEDLDLFQELADRAALALESGRLHRENVAARARAELLYRLAAGLIGAEHIGELFDIAVAGLEDALGAKRSAILAYDAQGVMRFRAWRGLSGEYRAAVEGHSPWAPDVVNPEPIVVPDVEQDPSLAPFLATFRREHIRALGFIPLVAEGRLIGKFMVYYEEPRQIGSHELDMAGAIANHVAAALTRFAAVEQLERTVRFNEMFTGMLGHDLRNPLNAIMTSAQLVLARDESPRLAKPLARILGAGSRMERMIDQLLDFTRVRVGSGIKLLPKAADLLAVLRQIIDELESAHPDVPLRLEHLGTTLGFWDTDRLSQVFSNLVGNAVRHGVPEQGCTVRVDGTASELLRVTVHNHGTIREELLPHIFEPMTGSERSRERSQGLGLGLFISHQIVKAHGGRLEVRSDAETGTTFTLSLPRQASRTGVSIVDGPGTEDVTTDSAAVEPHS
jgi:signal transduction histidine kinase